MDFDPSSWCRDASGFLAMALAVWACIVCGVFVMPAHGEQRDPPRRDGMQRERRGSRPPPRRRRFRRPPPLAGQLEPAEPPLP